ncbi:DUF4321 domain-containing protein [Paenibacillus sp. y28]|uniref:DUF4321 domain-containing protein n=1 Tax=Paenibacillus sp. y28 TaxID=3129110 RepID=UPI003019A849
MNKSKLTFCIFIIMGLLAGTLIGQLLAPVKGLSFLTQSTGITWEPRADLQMIKYDLTLVIRLNLMSILGVIAAIWLHRRM